MIIRVLVFIVLSILVSFRFPAVCPALDVTLSWNASSGANGYNIYYDSNYSASGPPYNGTGALEGFSPVNAGNVTRFTLHDLPENGYRFSLTAYNAYGESGYSAQIVLPPSQSSQYSLSVRVSGAGSVTPAGGSYAPGTTVRITATPASGWVFSGWSGDLNSSTNPARILMDTNKSVTAVFTRVPTLYSLTVRIAGQGSVRPSGGNYSRDATVQLTATPASGWAFSGWSGDIGGSSNPARITMDSNKSVLAAFRQESPRINVFSATPGSIGQGESAILVWDMSRGISASIDNGVGVVNPVRGSQAVTPLSTTTYTLAVTNAAGSDTRTATVRVGSEIVEVIPHDGAGIQDRSRISNDTSFAIRIIDPQGINIGNSASIRFRISDGVSVYRRNLRHNAVVTVTKLLDEDDSHVTDLWVAYHRAGETELGNYPFKSVINIEVDIYGNNGQTIQASYEFKTETEKKHNRAKSSSPRTSPLAPTDVKIIDVGYDASGVQVERGTTKGASIIYDTSGPITPVFGPSRELPPLRIKGIKVVGRPINMQPPTVFSTPTTLFIPCPRYADVSNLAVFRLKGKEWVLACDSRGNVLPGGDGWMVPGSRVNHNEGAPSTIEIKVYNTSGARAGAIR
ncbi:MAG TPA: hypothetical protein DCY35_04395 [Prolixibacteraceae bacterium]|nr:hypothetical protein [Prolixibacteraceae bacterium]